MHASFGQVEKTLEGVEPTMMCSSESKLVIIQETSVYRCETFHEGGSGRKSGFEVVKGRRYGNPSIQEA